MYFYTSIPVASVILPIANALCIGGNDGRVRVVNTTQLSEDSTEVLPGGHFPGHKVDLLVVLKGKLNGEGFLSAVGRTSVDEPSGRSYINSAPCTVLISTGIGFCDSFTQHTNESTCFISWAFPCGDRAI